ncbi:uncharacterized protein LOC123705358 [Colias croceus]|uniref:uncharacterized protein LOC123705358 n=1 Tax=Colias crocea TaxID=72248 RepID=UPI001E27FAD9|nr:uncharacterized protein LOC123705358 [Colias croceus]
MLLQREQACLFTAKRTDLNLTPSFQDVSLELSNELELLGLKLSSNLNFKTFIESKVQVAAKKLGILSKVAEFFTPEQLLNLYKAQVRSGVEYCSHLWAGAAKYQLSALDSIEKRAIRLIGNEALTTSKLHSLEHRRKVASLAVFYRIYHGECAEELHNLIPASPFYHRSSRRGAGLHPYVIDIPPIRTKRYASSFLVRTSREWNNLPACVFPDNYNLDLFKRKVNRHLLGQHVPS